MTERDAEAIAGVLADGDMQTVHREALGVALFEDATVEVFTGAPSTPEAFAVVTSAEPFEVGIVVGWINHCRAVGRSCRECDDGPIPKLQLVTLEIADFTDRRAYVAAGS